MMLIPPDFQHRMPMVRAVPRKVTAAVGLPRRAVRRLEPKEERPMTVRWKPLLILSGLFVVVALVGVFAIIMTLAPRFLSGYLEARAGRPRCRPLRGCRDSLQASTPDRWPEPRSMRSSLASTANGPRMLPPRSSRAAWRMAWEPGQCGQVRQGPEGPRKHSSRTRWLRTCRWTRSIGPRNS